MTLYAVWEKSIPVAVDSKNLSRVEKNVKKAAVSFANIFAKKSKSAEGTTTSNAIQQLKNLENQPVANASITSSGSSV